MILSNFDIFLSLLTLLFSLVGLVRGFLREMASVVNWFGAFYLTSLCKSPLVEILQRKITIPLLPDLIANVILFILFMIALSILTEYLAIRIRRVLPNSANSLLGFIFGILKGVLLLILFFSAVHLIYRNTEKKEPKIIKNSLFYQFYGEFRDSNIFSVAIENILGDMLEKKKTDEMGKILENNLINKGKNLDDMAVEHIKNMTDGWQKNRDRDNENGENIDEINDANGVSGVENDKKLDSLGSTMDNAGGNMADGEKFGYDGQLDDKEGEKQSFEPNGEDNKNGDESKIRSLEDNLRTRDTLSVPDEDKKEMNDLIDSLMD